jgi:hypothetical protein
MDKKTKITLCVFAVFLLVGSVSALTLDIVDKSYLQKNEFVISDHNGDRVANFTGDHSVTVPLGKSYFIDYQPVGLFDFGEEIPEDPFFLKTITGFFLGDKVLAGLIALCGILLVLGAMR